MENGDWSKKMIDNIVNDLLQRTNENRRIAARGGHFEVNEEKWRPAGLFTQQ